MTETTTTSGQSVTLISKHEAAEILGQSTKTIDRLARENVLTRQQRGLFLRTEVLEYAAQKGRTDNSVEAWRAMVESVQVMSARNNELTRQLVEMSEKSSQMLERAFQLVSSENESMRGRDTTREAKFLELTEQVRQLAREDREIQLQEREAAQRSEYLGQMAGVAMHYLPQVLGKKESAPAILKDLESKSLEEVEAIRGVLAKLGTTNTVTELDVYISHRREKEGDGGEAKKEESR